MSLEQALDAEMKKPGFGSSNCHLFFKERPHISKTRVDENGRAAYIDVDSNAKAIYSDTSTRYIASTDLTYDMLLSVYDVDTKELFVMRLFKHKPDTFKPLKKHLSGISRNKYKRLEARLIGLQDKEDYSILMPIFKELGKYRVPVVEVDLFGNQARHIALDSYLGTSFNILLLDRIYRPGELNAQITQEQFEAQMMKKGSTQVKA
ncbi:hypothetical protein B2A_02794 [mine drainage metagenome]|uniref:Uncharacterized protein n=1 Tax=mine drainage metagenome TaxID=410659 RepID=T1APH5_9ZZZZ